MKCCAVLGEKCLVWEFRNDGRYRSYFFEQRGYRPIKYINDVETLKGYCFHEFSLYELVREMNAVGKNPRLRGYYSDSYFQEELKNVLEMAKFYLSTEGEMLKISYGVKV